MEGKERFNDSDADQRKFKTFKIVGVVITEHASRDHPEVSKLSPDLPNDEGEEEEYLLD